MLTRFGLQILHSMVIAVSKLHEAGIAHNSISNRYFKVMPAFFLLQFYADRSSLQVFPLQQSVLSNHKLRVKLVGLGRASTGTSDNPSSKNDRSRDILELGKAMLWIANANLPIDRRGMTESLRSYDPCLMLLIEWMTEADESQRADIMDVLSHPCVLCAHLQIDGMTLSAGTSCR